MAGPKPLPTVEEIEALIDQVRRDPRSPAYVELADAYLALGRPRDAIDAAQLGLQQAPDDHAGRLALSRALAALHQWKDAQAELLKIVKVDRANRAGFALLGEVLMRRGDYERAMP
ncbi:MAG TPA: tetratricopeptide repeat protein, partial [Kofleriaceae bacterium]|nr:tetratricopeptide repeat protein [Kofleriaceae bacterium]